jgi:Zn-dependent M32 family carboxypeptidase
MKTYITKYGIEEKAKLKAKLADLLVERIKMDQFFDKFLDTFDSKMKPNETDTPVWKAYHEKFEQYEKLSREIQSTEHLLRRTGIV